MNVLVVVGTRPEIIKMSPIVAELAARTIPYNVVWTEQNVQPEMGERFFEEFDYDNSKILRTETPTFYWMTQSMKKADVVLVQGDTTTALLGAAAAVHTKTILGHVEAGLRSDDRRMREERNRRAIDQMSDMLFCPTTVNVLECTHECLGLIYPVGNTIADVLAKERRKGMVCVKKNRMAVTLHRPELVDDLDLLEEVLQALAIVAKRENLEIDFPTHPRTSDKLCERHVKALGSFHTSPPLPARKMWQLIMDARFVVTDSGGVQEEACILGTPCFTIRPTTERQETLDCGANRLIAPGRAEDMVAQMCACEHSAKWKQPYGENVAKQIIDLVVTYWRRTHETEDSKG